MDEKGRIVKVEYPDGKELHMTYPEQRPAIAKLIWGKASVVAQLDGDGLVKEETAIIKEGSK